MSSSSSGTPPARATGSRPAGPGQEEGGAPQPPPRRPRTRQTARDMLLSLAVVAAFLVPVLLLVPRPSDVGRADVDVAGAALGARERVEWPVPVPQVPEDWEANVARLEPAGPAGTVTWVARWVTPSGDNAGLMVAGGAVSGWVDAVTDAGSLEGEQEVAGEAWEVYVREPRTRSQAPLRALVREVDDVTVAVLGTAQVPELIELATATQDALAVAP
ncbi:DUF4245 domain-containing protein [Pseudokineococcus sp. 1T1Z-3]|uniref:DUF4245 domain-containing protein n=1 Tax=Pseudokineococcus sp. 1T1Z-3 TaxID=3132745 RepID=UPI00309FA181